jgi:exocyst complex component 4
MILSGRSRISKYFLVCTVCLFLDDFLLNVFVPQMEERVFSYFSQFVNGNDAFLVDTMDSGHEFPLIKSAVALTVLIQGMCRTLYAIPIHQEEVVRMIELVLTRFTTKCTARYEALLSREDDIVDSPIDISDANEGIVSSMWVEDGALSDLLFENPWLHSNGLASTSTTELNKNETELEMELKGDRSFHRNELVFDTRKLEALANLHHSIVSRVLLI